MSTKVWLLKGKEVAMETDEKPPSPSTTESPKTTPQDSTDTSPAPKDVSRLELLAHAYLGIIFGEPGWPYPEVLPNKYNF
jgi:hypothetical protein